MRARAQSYRGAALEWEIIRGLPNSEVNSDTSCIAVLDCGHYSGLVKKQEGGMEDLLRYDDTLPDEVPSARHVAKKDRRKKGVEAVFDPIAHREYITGFRKRKKQRQKEAMAKLSEVTVYRWRMRQRTHSINECPKCVIDRQESWKTNERVLFP